MAKQAGVTQLAAFRRQHGVSYICAMPTNLYGAGDNFSSSDSHVLAAMIRRFYQSSTRRSHAGDVQGNLTET